VRVAAIVGDDLIRRWSASVRRYHDLRHLTEVLDRLRTLPAGRSTTVRLAAWFHDAVYEPTAEPGASEAASAALGQALLPACGLEPDAVAEVTRLVLVTREHHVDGDDRPGAALVDADLAVLAAAPERYLDYAAGVRAEYSHLPEPVFRRGRSAVLHGLLARDRIFRTPVGRQRWESRARANLAVELRMLDAD